MSSPGTESSNPIEEKIVKLREETPGCVERIHLNNAGAGLMPRPVLDVMQNHLQLESQIGGYEAEEVSRSEIDSAYQSVANLVHGRPDNIAFVENATVAYAQALSSIPFRPDDVILTTQNDYVSNQTMFMSLAKRFGIRIVYADESAEGGADVTSMERLMAEHRPRLVAVTHIPTNSGLIQPVAEIGKLCRDREVLYLVDACQSIGQVPIDIDEIGCDFLSATSRKFLRGPRGCGFLFVSDRVLSSDMEPLFIDLQGAEWTEASRYEADPTAKRFENWEFAYALVLGTGCAAEYAINLGIHNIQKRSFKLAADLRDNLSRIKGVNVLDQGVSKCAIVTLHIQGCEPNLLIDFLRRKKINATISKRSYAVIDFDRKRVPWALRVSPHYYNTDQEIELAVDAITELAGS